MTPPTTPPARGRAARLVASLALAGAALLPTAAAAPVVDESDALTEADVYAVADIPIPEDLVLEVGGLLPDGRGGLYVCTRRGELWHVADADTDAPTWSLFADGLAEPLGLLFHDDALLVTQRAELTALRDTDADGRADRFDTLAAWDISGSYHEYAFGPRRDADGKLWVTLNRPFDAEPFGKVDWRGWALRIDPETGVRDPVACGLRSPAGVASSPDGRMVYTDNQGEWCGASKLSVLQPGDFHGHPMRIDDADLPGAGMPHPGEVDDGALFPIAARRIPSLRLPAVWFPYDVMGRSPSGLAWDETGGAFGPFAGQVFVGDQYQASVLRVALEEVDGVWQGACFPFREGLGSGVIRVAFDRDGSLLVGQSDRGWASLGNRPYGLQRITWTGETPFELHSIRARPEGFAVHFTRDVDAASVADPASWALRRFTYRLHSAYGSDEVDEHELTVSRVTVSGPRQVTLHVDGLRAGYVHEIRAPGVRDVDGQPLLHDVGFYTLTERPGPDAPTRVVFVAGDDEYRSEETLPMLAGVLERELGFDCTVLAPVNAEGFVDPGVVDDIPGLDTLADADALVLFTRWRELPEAQLDAILDFAEAGHPVVALRTATHAFRYHDDELAERAEAFVHDVVGQEWIAHHGGGSTTDLRPVDTPAEHPILRGVEPVRVPSWLYHVRGGGDRLAEGSEVLMLGKAIDSRQTDTTRYPPVQPVAWTREVSGRRSFTTTLGHPGDLRQPAVRRLVLQGLLWALDREARIPAEGLDVSVPAFTPAPVGVGAHRTDLRLDP